MIILIIISVVVNLIISDIVANIGKTKEIGYNTAFLVSFILTPLIGILLVIASPINTNSNIVENYTEENVKPGKPITGFIILAIIWLLMLSIFIIK